MRRLAMITMITALSLAGCSALGLVDGLEQEACRDCAELEAIMPTGDPCLSWQCSNLNDPAAGVCVIDVLDADADGAPAAMCVDEGPVDCDDGDGANAPGLGELCDLADNDCDGTIDEGALALERTDLTSAGTLASLAWGVSDMEALAVYNADGDLVIAQLPVTGASGTAAALGGVGNNPDPASTALTRAGNDWAIAYAPGAGCSRIVLATWNTSQASVTLPTGGAAEGLPKASGDCASGDMSEAGHPALASAADLQVLLAYLADRGERACGSDAVDVGLVVAQRRNTGGATFGDEGARASEVVGQSVDREAPALVAIEDYGYLLAFPRADGTIGVHRVQVDGETLETTVTRDVHVETCNGTCDDVALTVAGVSDETEVALSFREGDCVEGAAVLRVLSLDPTTGTLTPRTEALASERATGVRHPVAARRVEPDEWLLTWSTAGAESTVVMQRWTADGTPVGEARELLASAGTFNARLLATGGSGAEGFRVFAYDTAADALVRSAAQCVAQ